MKIFRKNLLFNKNYIKKLITFLLLLTGSFFSCQSKLDIDMSNIDFSNIENLYAQPLPVIQKCVQGKWKVYNEKWDSSGWSYAYAQIDVNIYNDHYIYTYHNDGSIIIKNYIWKRINVDNGYKTWVMCDVERSTEYNYYQYFHSIENDILITGRGPVNPLIVTFVSTSYVLIRDKE